MTTRKHTEGARLLDATADPRDAAVEPAAVSDPAPAQAVEAAHQPAEAPVVQEAADAGHHHHKKSHKTVRMTRDPEIFDEPHTADVHPSEVENFLTGGWQVDGSDSATKG